MIQYTMNAFALIPVSVEKSCIWASKKARLRSLIVVVGGHDKIESPIHLSSRL
jgi:hypothetical protein